MRHATLYSLALLALAARVYAEPISGRVVDEAGKSIAGATIVAEMAASDVKTVKSDAQGRFSIEVKASETWPDWLGRATAFGPGTGVGGVSLTRGDNVLRLGAATSASGLVRDAKGQPVAGAQVYVGSISDSEPREYISVFGAARDLLSATTGADGKWKIEHLPRRGSATVLLEDKRFEEAFVRLELAATATEAAEITARAGASITGRVVDEAGRPLAHIAVRSSPSERFEGGYSSGTTDAEGRFTLFSLPAGRFSIASEDPKSERVSIGLAGVALEAGASRDVGDIVMKPGALLNGTAMDNDGKPIKGVRINARLPKEQGNSGWDTTSDGAGRYSLRVPSGDVFAYVSGQPREFLAPRQGGNYTDFQIPLQVAEGQVQRRDWVLQRGASLSLQVLVEGKPVPNMALKLQGDAKDPFMGQPEEATTDAGGMASFVGLRPGEYTPFLEGGWEVVSPSKIMVGEDAAHVRKVVVKPLDLPTLRGRVLTAQGEPVAGATVHFVGYREMGGGRSTGDQQRQVSTDAQGNYEIARFKPEKMMSISARKQSHRNLNTVQIASKDGTYSVPDILLAPLDQAASGRVVDAQNQPVADAQVLAPEGDAGAVRSAADGRWSLKMLPRGQVRIVAASAGMWAESTIDTTTANLKPQDVALALRPLPILKSGDVFRGHDVLDEVKSSSRGQNYYASQTLPYAMAPFDFDFAIELASDAEGNVPEEQRALLFSLLASASPESAEAIADEQLALVKPERRVSMLAALGLGAAKDDPETARRIWQQLQVLVAERQKAHAAIDGRDALSMMTLAYALQLPDRARYLPIAREKMMLMARNGNDDFSSTFAITLARYDTAESDKILHGMGGSALVSALTYSIRNAAGHDVAAAVRWLEWLKSLPPKDEAERSMNGDPQWAFGQAAIAVIRALGAQDAAGALALARRVEHKSWRARALAQAALSQPKAQAAPLLREASAMEAPYVNDDTPVVIAARALQVDEALGREMLGEKKALYESKAGGADDYSLYMTLPSWAFYYARVDASASKMILERAWARRNEDNAADAPKVALAMAACDMDRALEMARSLEAQRGFDTRRKLAQYILASAETRRTMSFERWGRSDTWAPGEDE